MFAAEVAPTAFTSSLSVARVLGFGVAGFEATIDEHWFAVVSFQARSERTWDSWDQLELKAVESTPGYWLASESGGLIFIYRPDYRQSGR